MNEDLSSSAPNKPVSFHKTHHTTYFIIFRNTSSESQNDPAKGDPESFGDEKELRDGRAKKITDADSWRE